MRRPDSGGSAASVPSRCLASTASLAVGCGSLCPADARPAVGAARRSVHRERARERTTQPAAGQPAHNQRAHSASAPSPTAPRLLAMTPPSQRTVALLGLVLLAILLAASSDVQGDCRDCCSPNGTCERAFRHREGICCGILASRPYCCPTNSRCIQKSNTRFSCKLKNNAGKIGDPVCQ
jgi:hypothetical protein